MSTLAIAGGSLIAGQTAPSTSAVTQDLPADTRELQTSAKSKEGSIVVEPGTKIPLTLLNGVSTKQTAEGDRVYLETLYPILVNGKIAIPPGSYVAGTVTQVKRPGRVKGRGELYLRFDSLTLPNGVTRDFRARLGGMEGGGNNELDRAEGKIKGGGSKGNDARTVAQGAQIGTMAGGVAGALGGRPVAGVLGGAGAGAAAGLMGVLLSRGPDVVLARGSVVEMVIDRALSYDEGEVNFASVPPRSPRPAAAPVEPQTKQKRSWPLPF